MCTNFDFLKKEEIFDSFAEACISAENSLLINPTTSAISSRRALELAVKWMYSFDRDLSIPYDDGLSALIHEISFKNTIDFRLFDGIKYIVKLGNFAVHTNKSVTRKEAVLSLNYLFNFTDWIAYTYSSNYEEKTFSENNLPDSDSSIMTVKEKEDLNERLSSKDKMLEEMRRENNALHDEIKRRKEESQNESYSFSTVTTNLSEYETRKVLIDLDLKTAGWNFDKYVVEEEPLEGMPNKAEKGFADYVLYGKNGLPVAVVEAKKAMKDAKIGKQQARLYAMLLEKKYGQRPIIYYTNGLEIYMWEDYEGGYPPRKVNGFYTQDELMWIFQKQKEKKSLNNIYVDENITDRVYQREAITSCCESFEQRHRKALLIMATGTGKTRTAISLTKVLIENGWVKNVLFLADRTVLVKQAKKNFTKLLNESTCNLVEEPKEAEDSRIVFSTYQTMINAIDDTKNENGEQLFTPGHFDLIIADEVHRSIYKKYKAIFEYFDGLLVGLTATPRSDVDKNTYSFFDLEDNNPTYVYELSEAVEEGYLVDYNVLNCSTDILDRGVKYNELSDKEKEQYENLFEDEEVFIPEIEANKINEILFNETTVKMVLKTLMEKGLKVEGGDKIGKTIIFARNHEHAIFIEEIFNKLYPNLGGEFAQVIDNKINYSQSLIDSFEETKGMPQIAISVDMLDTGVDVPDILNLVFFKPIKSKIKFWQMIGRGTRLCPGVYGDADKDKFYIFDWCGNFDFFATNPNGIEADNMVSLSERLYNHKVNIIKELSDMKYQEDKKLVNFRNELIEQMVTQINALDINSFLIKNERIYIYKYNNTEAWQSLYMTDVADIKKHITPILDNADNDEFAKRFDGIVLSMMVNKLLTKNYAMQVTGISKIGEELGKLGTIPQVADKAKIIKKIQDPEYVASMDIISLEEMRKDIRELVKFIENKTQKIHPLYSDFEDDYSKLVEQESLTQESNFTPYKKRVERFLKGNMDNLIIYKIRHNIKISAKEEMELGTILFEELGTKAEYQEEYQNKNVIETVRNIVGLDEETARSIFFKYANENELNTKQQRFLKLLVDYVVKNGTISKEMLTKDPFTYHGTIIDIFAGRQDIVRRIVEDIDELNANGGKAS